MPAVLAVPAVPAEPVVGAGQAVPVVRAVTAVGAVPAVPVVGAVQAVHTELAVSAVLDVADDVYAAPGQLGHALSWRLTNVGLLWLLIQQE